MDLITEQVNQLIKKTLEMNKERKKEIQKEIEEAMNPCNASQPLPENYLSEEQDSKAEVQSKSEKTRFLSK